MKLSWTEDKKSSNSKIGHELESKQVYSLILTIVLRRMSIIYSLKHKKMDTVKLI